MVGISTKLLRHQPENVFSIQEDIMNLADMLLHPFHSFSLVFEAIVETTACYDLFASQEAPRSDSIINCRHYNLPPGGLDKASSIAVGVRIRVKATTLDIEIHR